MVMKNGNTRYNQMKEKRSETWNNKSEQEKNAINEKRRQNAHCGLYVSNKQYDIKELYFYAFRFQNGIKFGLTKYSKLYKRWRKRFIEKVLVFEKMGTALAISIEQRFKSLLECTSNDVLKTTEFLIMTDDNFNRLYKEFKCIN